jgi:PAS domain S-box-containing protein
MSIDEDLLHLLAGKPELFERLFDSLTDVMVYVKDAQGRYVWGNRLLIDRAGLGGRAQLVGRTADDLFPSAGQSTKSQDLAVIQSGRPSRDVLRCYRTSAGKRFWCMSFKFPMLDAGREVMGLVGLSRDLPRPGERHQSYDRLAQFLDYIDERLEENVLIANAAKHTSTSMDALGRLVHDVFGLTPKQLLQRKRMERACQMLEEGTGTITEVSGACGYADHSAFTRQFKAKIQITPAQYRATFKSVTSGAHAQRDQSSPTTPWELARAA